MLATCLKACACNAAWCCERPALGGAPCHLLPPCCRRAATTRPPPRAFTGRPSIRERPTAAVASAGRLASGQTSISRQSHLAALGDGAHQFWAVVGPRLHCLQLTHNEQAVANDTPKHNVLVVQPVWAWGRGGSSAGDSASGLAAAPWQPPGAAPRGSRLPGSCPRALAGAPAASRPPPAPPRPSGVQRRRHAGPRALTACSRISTHAHLFLRR